MQDAMPWRCSWVGSGAGLSHLISPGTKAMSIGSSAFALPFDCISASAGTWQVRLSQSFSGCQCLSVGGKQTSLRIIMGVIQAPTASLSQTRLKGERDVVKCTVHSRQRQTKEH